MFVVKHAKFTYNFEPVQAGTGIGRARNIASRRKEETLEDSPARLHLKRRRVTIMPTRSRFAYISERRRLQQVRSYTNVIDFPSFAPSAGRRSTPSYKSPSPS